MCIIGVYKKGSFMPEEEIEAMWQNNDDGAGFAYYDENTQKWIVKKGFMKLSKLLKELESLGFLNSEIKMPFVIHFRAATHGGIRASLTHPFKIKAFDGELYIFHNGVFSLSRVLPQESKGRSSYTSSSYSSYPYYSSYSNLEYGYCGTIYNEKSEEKNGEEEIITEDPYELKIHSDTSYFCKLISDLNFSLDNVLTLMKNPLLSEIINYSRICVCVNGNPEPILLGSWITENNKFFSNGGYKSKYFYSSSTSKKESFDDKTFSSISQEDYSSISGLPMVKVGKFFFSIDNSKKIAIPYMYDGQAYPSDYGSIILDGNTKTLKLLIKKSSLNGPIVDKYDIIQSDQNKIGEDLAVTNDGTLYYYDKQKKVIVNKFLKERIIFPKITYFVKYRDKGDKVEIVKIKYQNVKKEKLENVENFNLE